MADRPEYKSKWTGKEIDDAIDKITGNGVEPLTTANIVQITGTSLTKVMSQAAVTNALSKIDPSDKIQTAIQEHNSSEQAHPYIQGLVNAKPNALNDRSDSQKDTYSANYINNSFAPITFVSNLYAQKTGDNTAILVNEQPILSAENILTSANTTNTDYNWTVPDFTLTRTLEVNTTLTATNSFAVNLTFQTSRNATISWGAKLKVSQDDGQTWQYISDNQAYGAIFYETGIGNTAIFNVFANTLQGTETYPIGTLLAIELYKKQSSVTSLTTTVYCGVEVDNAGIYTYAQFNFANVSIGTNQIEDGSVTLQKLEQNVQNTINSVAGKVDSFTGNTSTGYSSEIKKTFESISFSVRSPSASNTLILRKDELMLNGVSIRATIILENLQISNWVEDSTYTSFGYKADITINNLKETDLCEVIFSQDDAASGNYAQVNSSTTNTLTIYSKVNTEITIPTIIVLKGGN